MQKMAFQEGIVWNRENDNYLTPKENLALVALKGCSDFNHSTTDLTDKEGSTR